MKLRDIPNYLQAKVRMQYWLPEDFIQFDGIAHWHDENGILFDFDLSTLANDDIWELYVEPKKTKKITLYTPVYKHKGGYYYAAPSLAVSDKEKDLTKGIYKTVGWLSQEVEVEE